MNRLLEKYTETVKPSLMKEFNYTSTMPVSYTHLIKKSDCKRVLVVLLY